MRRSGLSFQARMQLFVLLSVALPGLAMGTYFLSEHHRVLEGKVRETVANQLFRATTRLDDWTQQRVHEVTRWSTSFIVFEGMEGLGRPASNPAQIRADVEDYLKSVIEHHPVYESLFVVDPRGNVVAATGDEAWEPWSDAGLDAVGVDAGTVSPIYRSPRLGRPTRLVLHAVQGRSPVPLGFLAGRLKLSEVEALLRRPQGGPDFWLLDDQGRIVLREGKVVRSPAAEAFPAPLPAADAEPGPASESDLPGLGRIVYGLRRRSNPEMGYVAATVSASEAFASLLDARRRMLLTGLAVLAAVLLLSMLVARSLLRPVRLLVQAAEQVKGGKYDISVPVRGGDELADLTRTFNDMAARFHGDRKQLVDQKDKLARLSITDDLTGLFNRRHFDDELSDAMERCANDGQPLSLLLIDLDHFKDYNDRWGHLEGDAELKRVAIQVQTHVRSDTDQAFRYGGEELAVILPHCNKDNAAVRAEKIRLAVRTPGQRPGTQSGRYSTVSIGVATFPEDGNMARALLDVADSALYEAKRLGRDRVRLAGRPGPEPDVSVEEAG
jgi:diguanylate cyclase (GGDEF)-like protein